jgi:hypothetical protein
MKTFRQFIEDVELDDGAFDTDASHQEASGFDQSIKRRYAGSEQIDQNNWKKLPVTFPIKGFDVLYSDSSGYNVGGKTVALVDTRDTSKMDMPAGFAKLPKDLNRAAVVLDLERDKFEVPGGTIYGLTTNLLSARKEYHGSGLAPLVYETLIRGGQTLFSSNVQTSGAQSVWRRITKSLASEAHIFVIIRDAEDATAFVRQAERRIKTPPREIALTTWAQKEWNKYNKELPEDNLDLLNTVRENYLLTGSPDSLFRHAYVRYSSRWCIMPKGIELSDRMMELAIPV